MKFERRHWTVALLAAALLQLALAAVLYHSRLNGTSDLRGGVEIEIGTALASVAGTVGRPVPGTETANHSTPARQVKSNSPAATSSDLNKEAALSEKEKNRSPSLAETADAPAILSPPKPTTRPESSARTQALATVENRLTQTEVRKPAPQKSGMAAAETASGIAEKKGGSAEAVTTGPSDIKGNSGVAATVSPEYYLRLAAWLEKHKRYPRRAVQRRQQGVVKVSFKIDRQGNLLSREIIRSSGYRLLDEAADSLLQRASPMPGIPQQSAVQVLEVIVPIMYALR